MSRICVAAPLFSMGLTLLVGLPAIGYAQATPRLQGCPPSGAFASIAASLDYTPCAVVTIPQGRQFVILTLQENFAHWQNGNGCASNILGPCDPVSLTVSINPIGFSYTLKGNTGAPPPGTGWTDGVGPSLCIDPLCDQCAAIEQAAISNCGTDQSCIIQAQAAYTACTANLAHDSQIESSRQTYKVVPLPPGLTSGGSVTLQISTTATSGPSDTGGLIFVTAGLYSDTHFTLTQTLSAFRPLDSRDAAANCANPGAPGDPDCHPLYTAQFVCNTSQATASKENSPSQPLLLAAAGAWPRSSAFSSLRKTPPWPILPFVSAPPPCASPPVKYKFQLAPQTQWLPGTSTNFGNETAANPDYVFEQGTPKEYTAPLNANLAAPQDDRLSIGTPGFVTSAQNVTVSSRDFGGAAQLRATATFQQGGLSFDADVVGQNGTPVQPPSGACGATFTQQQFASLPVDQDCDGIADSWEDQNSTQNGVHLPVTWDMEPGVGANSPMGDGYSVHDEYRGFHYVLDNGAVKWESTDPMNKLDVFFWDQSNQFTKPLRQVLDQQSAKFVFRRVNDVQANALSRRQPSRGARRLNRNSITLTSQEGYAVVYVSDSLTDQRTPIASTLGFTRPNANHQSVNDGNPITIDTNAISAAAQSTGFPRATLLAQVVAHETGHRFTRTHPIRPNCCWYVSLPIKQLTSLTQSQFAFPGGQSSAVYVRLTQFAYPDGRTGVGDHLYLDVLPGFAINEQHALTHDDPNVPVYQVNLNRPLSATVTHLLVENQLLELMDWEPHLTQQMEDPAAWRFDPASDLPNLCVRMVCVCPAGNCQ